MKRLALAVFAIMLLFPLFAELISIGGGNMVNQGLPIEPVACYSYTQQLFLASDIGISGVIDSLSFKYNVGSDLFYDGNKQWKIWLGHSSRGSISSWVPGDSLYLVYDGVLQQSDFSSGLPGTGWLKIALENDFFYNGSSNLVLAVDENSSDYGSTSDDFYCTETGQPLAIKFQSQTINPDPYAPPATGFSLRTQRSNLRINIQALHYTPLQPNPPNGANGVVVDTNLSWQSICESFTLRFGPAVDSLEIMAEFLPNCLWQSTAPLDFNKQYFWQVTGFHEGVPYPSPLWSFRTCGENISPPRNLTGSYNGQVVNLAWEAPSVGTVQAYQIYRNSALLASGTEAYWQDADVQQGITYYYYVTACNSSGTQSGASNIISISIPNTPPGTILYQGFEACPSFSIVIPHWQNLDLDLSPTWVWDDVNFPLEGNALGWLCFAPAETNPPLSGHPAFSGSKMLMAMSSLNPPNNDLLISPALHLGTAPRLEFKARSALADFGLERLKLLISVSDANPESFIPLSSGAYLSVPVAWTDYSYDLAAYAGQRVFLAWQCLSVDAFALFLDEISVISTGGWVGTQDACLPAPAFYSYPNPSNSEFCIPGKSGDRFSLELYNQKGQKLYAADKLQSFSSNQLNSHLPSGIYFIRIRQGAQCHTLKHIVAK